MANIARYSTEQVPRAITQQIVQTTIRNQVLKSYTTIQLVPKIRYSSFEIHVPHRYWEPSLNLNQENTRPLLNNQPSQTRDVSTPLYEKGTIIKTNSSIPHPLKRKEKQDEIEIEINTTPDKVIFMKETDTEAYIIYFNKKEDNLYVA